MGWLDTWRVDWLGTWLTARQVHGVWRGTTWTTKGLYPVLSYARPSAFADIPIPSRYQWVTDESYAYRPDTDIPWAQKQPSIYWRGEPSGGGHGDQYYGSVLAPPLPCRCWLADGRARCTDTDWWP